MRDTPRSVMIFAAGRGTRMAPLTDDRPKPMVEVAGKPLIRHALDIVHKSGIADIVVNTHYLPELLNTYLADTGVRTVHEPVLLETGGGLRNAIPLLGPDPVITLNSDAIWSGPNPIKHLLNRWDPEEMDALLCLIQPETAIGHQGVGDFSVNENGRLARAPGFVYSGLQIIKTDSLDAIPDVKFSLNVVWDQMLAQERIYGVVYDGSWCDVGQPESILLAEAMLSV